MEAGASSDRARSFPEPPGQKEKHGFQAMLEDVRGSVTKATLYLGRLEKLVETLAEEHEMEVVRARASAQASRVPCAKGNREQPVGERSLSRNSAGTNRSGDTGSDVFRKETTGESKVSWEDMRSNSGVLAVAPVAPVAEPAGGEIITNAVINAVPVSATNPSKNYQPLAQAAEPSEPDDPEDSTGLLVELPRCISGDTVVALEEMREIARSSSLSRDAAVIVEPCPIWTSMNKRPSQHIAKGAGSNRRETQVEGQAKRQSMKVMGRGLSRSKSNLFHTNKKPSMSRKLTSAVNAGDREECLKTLSETLVASPTSSRRLLWDIAGMALIAYDLVMFPLQFFDPPRYIFFDVIGLITSIFWTVDIPMSFFVGYHDGGVIKMSLIDISRKYARSWLFFDICVVTIDWVATIIDLTSEDESTDEAAANVGAVRAVKSARFLRMLRLLRLLKVSGMFEHILEHIQSEFTRIILGICQLIAFIICANHVIACGFYAISRHQIPDFEYNERWVIYFKLEERSLAYRYFTSLHWSLTQFTPASMEIVPRNAGERIYNVVTLLFAMITFSSFVSSLTNAMTQLRNLNSEKLAQYSILRKYLRDHEVTVQLTTRIWHWLHKDTKGHRRRIHEKEVTILAMLPSTLQAELRNQVVGPFLVPHPFFFQFGGSMPMLMRRVYKNLLEHSAMSGKEIFAAGDVGDSMYFIVDGRCKYYSSLSGINFDGSQTLVKNGRLSTDSSSGIGDIVLTKGGWLCEQVLWVKWKHIGQAVAKEHTDLFMLAASRFHHIIEHNLGEAWSVVRYARLFAQRLRSQQEMWNEAWADFDILQEMAHEAFQDEEQDLTDVSISLSRVSESNTSGKLFDPMKKKSTSSNI